MHGELNEAQQAAVMHKDGALLIVAGAGAGKTRVVVHRIAELIHQGVRPEKILAVTFTNKAANEMKTRVGKLIGADFTLSPYDRPRTHPFIGTFHVLCLHIIRTFHKDAGLPARFTIYDRSDSTRAAKEAIVAAGFDPKELDPRRVISAMGRAKGEALSPSEFRDRAKSYIDDAIAEVWERYDVILAKENALDFDDILVTAYRLLAGKPHVREHFQGAWEYLHVDEYQDTNGVQYEIMRMLAEKHGNLAVVGDHDQCLVVGTAVTMADGSQKPIEKVRRGDMVLSNFGSGTMRPAAVTRAVRRGHRGDLIVITTEGGKTLTSTPEHIHFAGYRLGIVPQSHFTYLMHKREVGWRLGTSQVYTKGQRRPMVGFQQRCNQEHADAVWIVGVHQSPNEARVLEYRLSLTHRIPTLPFVARKGLSTGGYVHDQEALSSIFKSFDTEKAARSLLWTYGLSYNHPHHRAQSHVGVRRNVTLTLCGDGRSASTLHRIAMVGNDEEGRVALRGLGFSVRPAKPGLKSWRFETAHKDYGALVDIVARLRTAFPDLVIVENARLGVNKKNQRNGNSLRFTPAASVMPGMALFNTRGGYDIVKKVERTRASSAPVYDLDVQGTHNFIANGIVTHNCIYSWRGASLDHIMNFERDFPGATTVILTENYRSTKTILAAANDAIAKNLRRKEKVLVTANEDGEKIAVAGLPTETEEARFVARECSRLIQRGAAPEDIAVLYRANFQSRVLEEEFLRADVAYQVLGTRFFERKEIKDALSYLKLATVGQSAAELARAIASPARGLGKVALAKVLSGRDGELPDTQRQKVHAFRAALERIAERSRAAPASETVRYALNESGLWRLYEEGHGEDEERLENLKELVSVAAKYDGLPPGEGVARLLDEAALQSDQDELPQKREDRPGVKLMTVHAAKGLEFPVVFVVGLEEGLFPHERDGEGDDEEERRLFYVALTRAEKKAYLTYAETRRIFGRPTMNVPSEFVTEMDQSLVEVVEARQPYEEEIS
jgi:DNA helicase-2/ATP-dependent DNA helicase PcrA